MTQLAAVGPRVRALREAEGLSLRDLAEGGAVSTVGPAERRAGGAAGHRYEVLTPPLPGQRAEVSRHTLAPGAATGGAGHPPLPQPGPRETAGGEAGTVTR